MAFEYTEPNITASALRSAAITPNDGADLPFRVRMVTLGTLAWINWNGVTCSTAFLPAGPHPLFAKRILATGTTAADITGWE